MVFSIRQDIHGFQEGLVILDGDKGAHGLAVPRQNIGSTVLLNLSRKIQKSCLCLAHR